MLVAVAMVMKWTRCNESTVHRSSRSQLCAAPQPPARRVAALFRDQNLLMEPPEASGYSPDKVFLLKKCLYGLKQAPLMWYKTLTEEFNKHGFKVGYADQSLLTFTHSNEKCFALIYVDDQVITGPNKELNAKIKQAILGRFPGEDLGEAKFYVGIRLIRDFEKKTIKLSQERHIKDAVLEFLPKGMDYPVYTPTKQTMLRDFLDETSEPFSEPDKYLSLVGTLLYLAMTCRPDIAYIAGVLSRFNHKPTVNHWDGAVRALQYLNATATYGLVYGNKINTSYWTIKQTDKYGCEELVNRTGTEIIAFADASGTQPPDSRATYGYTFLLNGAAICWTSKKQQQVAYSTGDAEFVALSLAAKESLWIRKLTADTDINDKPIQIYNDSTNAVKEALEFKTFDSRLKYLGVHYKAIIERSRLGNVQFSHVKSADNVADIFMLQYECSACVLCDALCVCSQLAVLHCCLM
jgi:hypothetical protein